MLLPPLAVYDRVFLIIAEAGTYINEREEVADLFRNSIHQGLDLDSGSRAGDGYSPAELHTTAQLSEQKSWSAPTLQSNCSANRRSKFPV